MADPVYEAVNPDQSPLNQGEYKGTDPIYQNAANETDVPLNSGDEEETARKAGTPVENEVVPSDADKVASGVPVEKKEAEPESGATDAKTPATPETPKSVPAKPEPKSTTK